MTGSVECWKCLRGESCCLSFLCLGKSFSLWVYRTALVSWACESSGWFSYFSCGLQEPELRTRASFKPSAQSHTGVCTCVWLALPSELMIWSDSAEGIAALRNIPYTTFMKNLSLNYIMWKKILCTLVCLTGEWERDEWICKAKVWLKKVTGSKHCDQQFFVQVTQCAGVCIF